MVHFSENIDLQLKLFLLDFVHLFFLYYFYSSDSTCLFVSAFANLAKCSWSYNLVDNIVFSNIIFILQMIKYKILLVEDEATWFVLFAWCYRSVTIAFLFFHFFSDQQALIYLMDFWDQVVRRLNNNDWICRWVWVLSNFVSLRLGFIIPAASYTRSSH